MQSNLPQQGPNGFVLPGLVLLTTAFVLSTLLFTKVVLKYIVYYIFKEEMHPAGPVQLVVTVTCMHILQCCMEIVH